MSLILSGTDGLSDVDGSAATPAIRGTDANTGIFFGTDIIGFSEGGVEAMRIDASGNLGLGVTSVLGRAQFNVSDTSTTILNSTVLYLSNTGAATTNQRIDLGFRWQDGTYNGNSAISAIRESGTARLTALAFCPSNSSGDPVEKMRIDSSGNVGIGTASPTALLTAGSLSDGTPATYGGTIKVASATQTSINSVGGIELNVATGYSTKIQQISSGGANLTFCGRQSSATWSEYMRIDPSGNVGIGTSSPAYKLDVSGPATATPVTNGIIRILTTGSNPPTGNGGGLVFSQVDSGSTNRDYASITGSRVDSTSDNRVDMVFSTGNPGASVPIAERMRINTDGKVGINTSGAAYGGTVFRVGVNDTNYCMGINATAGGTTDMIDFYSSGTFAGKISSNGATTAYNTSSDYRLKEDVQPMTGALAKVSALKPVTFKWISDGNEGEGFIAHELAEVCPYAVNGEKDEVDAEGNIRAQSIDTSFLVATLTAAIQEQQALITALTARITALESN